MSPQGAQWSQFSLSLFSAESQRQLPPHRDAHHDPVPTKSWLITPETKRVLLGYNFRCLEISFFLPKPTQLKTTVSGFPLYLLLKNPLCHFFNHPHSSGHRTVRLEQAHCIISNHSPPKMHHVLSSTYFKLKEHLQTKGFYK